MSDPLTPQLSPTPADDSSVERNTKVSEPEKKRKSPFRETFETIAISLGLALITRAAVAEPRFIPSESMLPTLAVQDRLIVEKVSQYSNHVPKRGDIVVFYPPSEMEENSNMVNDFITWFGFSNKQAYIKRVVGLPGEIVEVHNGQVFINGRPMEEHYINEQPLYDMQAQTVPEGSVFVMGDNRNNSADSHVWGPLPIKNVIGKAAFRFWPMQRIGPL